MKNKEFVDIKGYENLYKINRNGDVIGYEKKWITGRGKGRPHTQKEHFIKPSISKFGYLRVTLWKNNKQKKFHVHTLVANTFCPGYKKGLQVNHIDGIKLNNNYLNLEWVTASKNIQHSFDIGLRTINEKTRMAVSKASSGGKNNNAKKVIDIKNGKVYETIKEAAESNGISVWNLYVYLRGVNKNYTNLRYGRSRNTKKNYSIFKTKRVAGS